MSSIKVSFTQFIKYTALNPNKRLQHVHDIKYKKYKDMYDYWGYARNGFVRFHKKGLELDSLDNIVLQAPPNHRPNYRMAINNYKKFLKRNRKIEWFKTEKKYFFFEDLAISVGADVGLKLNGVPHFIKFFFTDDGGATQKLDDSKAQLMIQLMKYALHEQLTTDSRLAIINIRDNARIMRDNQKNKFTEENLILNFHNFIKAWNMV
ncbi:hypothetical protein [Aneurinibacillus aneurinilyticus]|uniref:hypothetical protein n=1 Tax=Aneurinibacillus aneurinilyticus TaxID=1391 RepID=UPI00366D462D